MLERAALFVRLPADMMAAVDERVRVTGLTKQALITDLVETALGVPSTSVNDHTVLDLDEVALLLRVRPEQVVQRIADGGLPGRRFEDQWRFSRDAVMRWLDDADKVKNIKPGFAS